MKYNLGDICKIVSGTTPKTGCPEYWDGDIKWITPAEIHDDTYIVTDSERKITELGVRKTGLSPFPAGTVILSSRAPIGKVAIAGCEMYCNQGFKNLICSEKIHNKFLYWFLKGKTDFLNSLGRGATFKEISKTIVEQIEIELPDLARQKKIAAVFERIRSLLLFRRAQLSTLDELVKARFVEMFGDPLADNENTQRLSSCGKIYTGNTPPMREASYYESRDIPFVKPGNLAEHGVTRIENVEEFVSEKARGVARIMPPGAVLVTCIETIGKVGIASRECCCNQQINFIVPNANVDSVYLAYCLTFFVEKIKDMANAPVVPILNKTHFSSLEIPVPTHAMQKQFADFVAHTELTKAAVGRAMGKTQVLFDSLMQEYFR